MGGMTGSLLLLLWAGVSVSTMVDLQKRVIEGQNCSKSERLYHVALRIKTQTGTRYCGGSLISDEWILTAAHCWNVTHDKAIKAVLGVHPGDNEGGHSETMEVDKIEIFKDTDGRTHDIMLLKLKKNATGFHHIDLPYCAYHPTPKKGTKVQIAGHGAIAAFPNGTRNPTVESHLKCADIEVEDCPWVSKPSLNRKPHEHRFCGKTDDKTNPVDACKGDSGGGVVYKDKIYGVISRAGKIICTKEVKFMDVCGYMWWITDITGIIPPK